MVQQDVFFISQVLSAIKSVIIIVMEWNFHSGIRLNFVSVALGSITNKLAVKLQVYYCTTSINHRLSSSLQFYYPVCQLGLHHT